MISLKHVFDVSWRVAILALPWQTRWMGEVPLINGFPWEQGTVAVYASWVPMMLAIVTGLALRLNVQTSGISSGTDIRIPATDVLVAMGLLIAAALFTTSGVATLLWVAHVMVLGVFCSILLWNRIGRDVCITWFIVSLVPHAALGIWQFTVQHTLGNTLLGIAGHYASDVGVSVIEHGDLRALRAYGGFPHPNMLGGWLAVGLTLLPDMARRAKSNLHTLATVGCAALFMLALMLSFSRGAWIAATLGVCAAIALAWRASVSAADTQAISLVIAAILLMVGMVAVVHQDLVTARFTPSERLERWSLEQRSTALKDGIAAWWKRPLIGWGPGAALIGVQAVRTASTPVALEPPHVVPIAVLVEVGILGLIGCLALLWRVILKLLTSKQLIATLPLILATVGLLATDHYLWTLWAGQSLAAFLLTAVLLATHVPRTLEPS